MRRAVLLLTAATVAFLTASGVALAAITATSDAGAIATAVARDTDYVTGASFVALPAPADPGGASASASASAGPSEPGSSATPNAVSTTLLAGFPSHADDYGILTTGDANLADDPDGSQGSGKNLGGGNVRGDTDFDVSVLKIDLNVPSEMNCLTIDFRFLSEEYPEYVGEPFNDAFIAELDDSTWTTSGSNIIAPNNFAFDQNGQPISINSTGETSVNPAYADGTTYDAATARLQSRTPITPGAHSLYLSIFDQGDHILDSAAFVDNVRLITQSDDCVQGAIITDEKPPVIKNVSPTGKTADRTPAVKAKVTDGNTNLAKEDITLEFDGAAVPQEKLKYSAKEVLSYAPPKLSFGTHTVKITATDAAGNTVPKQWNFKVVK